MREVFLKMTETEQLLNKVKRMKGLTSDYQLAALLGWHRAVVSNYRTGKRQMDTVQVLDFAEKTGIPAEEVLRASVSDQKSNKRGKRIQGTLNLEISA